MNSGKKSAHAGREGCQAGAKARKLSGITEGSMPPLDSSQNVMKKCSNPEHPHCTFWVLPGENVCAANHRQATIAPSSYDLLSALRSARSEPSATAIAHAPAPGAAITPLAAAAPVPAAATAADGAPAHARPAAPATTRLPAPATAAARPAYQPVQAHLHISGFDPRAAGGRHRCRRNGRWRECRGGRRR